jgi:hypothetical protein
MLSTALRFTSFTLNLESTRLFGVADQDVFNVAMISMATPSLNTHFYVLLNLQGRGPSCRGEAALSAAATLQISGRVCVVATAVLRS